MSELHKIFESATQEKFEANQVIVNAFDEPSGVYLIESGFVKSYTLTDHGNINMQLIRSEGDVFPLLWGMGKITRDIYFAAMNDVVVKKLSLKQFQAKTSNSLAQKQIQDQLLEVYLLLAERVRCLEQRSVKERLLCCLNNLGERFGEEKADYVVLKVPVHHHDIADLINASRESTSREFSKLEKVGLVGYENGRMFIRAYA
jgi:CRP/FNR family transcriptional regulator